MNSIEGIQDKSDYEVYDDYLNFRIDGIWLDEKIAEVTQNPSYKNLVPTLLFWIQEKEEKEIVWNRILPKSGEQVICPILMCPDDCDFSCTLIIAEIAHTGSSIKWNRLGIDQTTVADPEKVGSEVKWFNEFPALEFELTAYHGMLQEFQEQYVLSKKAWKEKYEQ